MSKFLANVPTVNKLLPVSITMLLQQAMCSENL